MNYKVLFFSILFLSANTLLSAQNWEIPNNIKGEVWELYPDSVTDRLFVGGIFSDIDDIHTGNMTAFDGTDHHSIVDSMNACWNLGCMGVASIIRYKGDIIASLIRSSTYEANPQIIGIGRWDGQQWNPMGGGIADDYNNFVQQWEPAPAYDFCIADDTLYLAGYIDYADSIPTQGVAAWNGTTWRTYSMPPYSQFFDATLATCIAKYKGDLYVGGNFSFIINGEDVADFIKYDGISWQKVGDGLTDGWTNLHDLEVFQGKLYVAGYFTKADGNAGNSIMSWDGEHWDDLGGGICSPFGAIDDLFVYKDKLYVAGAFSCISGIEASNVAVWDGSKWCSIGDSKIDRAVHAIAVWRDTIYIGGSFYTIDDAPAYYFARYIGDPANSVCSEPVSTVQPENKDVLRVVPNPANNEVTLTLPTAYTGDVRIQITDALGRVLLTKDASFNNHTVNIDIEDLPAGMFFITVFSPGRSGGCTKFVRI